MTVDQILEALSQRDLLELAQVIAARHHLSLKEMFSRLRYQPAPRARAEFWAYLHGIGWSSVRIGQLTGHDHTTVLHGLRGVALAECRPVERVGVAS